MKGPAPHMSNWTESGTGEAGQKLKNCPPLPPIQRPNNTQELDQKLDPTTTVSHPKSLRSAVFSKVNFLFKNNNELGWNIKKRLNKDNWTFPFLFFSLVHNYFRKCIFICQHFKLYWLWLCLSHSKLDEGFIILKSSVYFIYLAGQSVWSFENFFDQRIEAMGNKLRILRSSIQGMGPKLEPCGKNKRNFAFWHSGSYFYIWFVFYASLP